VKDIQGPGIEIELTWKVCAAVSYLTVPGSEPTACRPIYASRGMATLGNGQSLNGDGQSEVKRMTCAQAKALFTRESNLDLGNDSLTVQKLQSGIVVMPDERNFNSHIYRIKLQRGHTPQPCIE
jgi:hypothetical protein